jgi:hypothetical protein
VLIQVMLGPDGKPLTGGPFQLTADQANAMRAAAKLAVSQPSASTEFTSSQASTRPPTPLSTNDVHSEEMTEDQKRRLASARRMSGRAGGQATGRVPG